MSKETPLITVVDVRDRWVEAQDNLRELMVELGAEGRIREPGRKKFQEVLDCGQRMSEEIVERREALDNLKRNLRAVFDFVDRLRETSR